MEKIIKGFITFLKSKGFRCLLITFLVCAFFNIWTGLAVTVGLIVCNFIYTRVLDLYNLIGFAAGWGLSVLQHWIY